ncbi:MAG: FAD:protein FMN transferase, partial [Kangiellaceae bacterium]|nr:FAD:protein FMN transferase [Kangiellaceae bacterium]
LSINLSAIAKGYGVDQVAALIELNEIKNYLVEIGGETASKGVNTKGNIWRLAIEAPIEQHRKIQTIFSPKGLGVATSGDYRNYFEKDGVRFSHTIDPTTGKPITHSLASVTVLHEKTMVADAYATAFMVMGKELTLEFAKQHNLPVYLLVEIDNRFEAFYSAQFSQYLVNKE